MVHRPQKPYKERLKKLGAMALFLLNRLFIGVLVIEFTLYPIQGLRWQIPLIQTQNALTGKFEPYTVRFIGPLMQDAHANTAAQRDAIYDYLSSTTSEKTSSFSGDSEITNCNLTPQRSDFTTESQNPVAYNFDYQALEGKLSECTAGDEAAAELQEKLGHIMPALSTLELMADASVWENELCLKSFESEELSAKFMATFGWLQILLQVAALIAYIANFAYNIQALKEKVKFNVDDFQRAQVDGKDVDFAVNKVTGSEVQDALTLEEEKYNAFKSMIDYMRKSYEALIINSWLQFTTSIVGIVQSTATIAFAAIDIYRTAVATGGVGAIGFGNALRIKQCMALRKSQGMKGKSVVPGIGMVPGAGGAGGAGGVGAEASADPFQAAQKLADASYQGFQKHKKESSQFSFKNVSLYLTFWGRAGLDATLSFLTQHYHAPNSYTAPIVTLVKGGQGALEGLVPSAKAASPDTIREAKLAEAKAADAQAEAARVTAQNVVDAATAAGTAVTPEQQRTLNQANADAAAAKAEVARVTAQNVVDAATAAGTAVTPEQQRTLNQADADAAAAKAEVARVTAQNVVDAATAAGTAVTPEQQRTLNQVNADAAAAKAEVARVTAQNVVDAATAAGTAVTPEQQRTLNQVNADAANAKAEAARVTAQNVVDAATAAGTAVTPEQQRTLNQADADAAAAKAEAARVTAQNVVDAATAAGTAVTPEQQRTLNQANADAAAAKAEVARVTAQNVVDAATAAGTAVTPEQQRTLNQADADAAAAKAEVARVTAQNVVDAATAAGTAVTPEQQRTLNQVNADAAAAKAEVARVTAQNVVDAATAAGTAVTPEQQRTLNQVNADAANAKAEAARVTAQNVVDAATAAGTAVTPEQQRTLNQANADAAAAKAEAARVTAQNVVDAATAAGTAVTPEQQRTLNQADADAAAAKAEAARVTAQNVVDAATAAGTAVTPEQQRTLNQANADAAAAKAEVARVTAQNVVDAATAAGTAVTPEQQRTLNQADADAAAAKAEVARVTAQNVVDAATAAGTAVTPEQQRTLNQVNADAAAAKAEVARVTAQNVVDAATAAGTAVTPEQQRTLNQADADAAAAKAEAARVTAQNVVDAATAAGTAVTPEQQRTLNQANADAAAAKAEVARVTAQNVVDAATAAGTAVTPEQQRTLNQADADAAAAKAEVARVRTANAVEESEAAAAADNASRAAALATAEDARNSARDRANIFDAGDTGNDQIPKLAERAREIANSVQGSDPAQAEALRNLATQLEKAGKSGNGADTRKAALAEANRLAADAGVGRVGDRIAILGDTDPASDFNANDNRADQVKATQSALARAELELARQQMPTTGDPTLDQARNLARAIANPNLPSTANVTPADRLAAAEAFQKAASSSSAADKFQAARLVSEATAADSSKSSSEKYEAAKAHQRAAAKDGSGATSLQRLQAAEQRYRAAGVAGATDDNERAFAAQRYYEAASDSALGDSRPDSKKRYEIAKAFRKAVTDANMQVPNKQISSARAVYEASRVPDSGATAAETFVHAKAFEAEVSKSTRVGLDTKLEARKAVRDAAMAEGSKATNQEKQAAASQYRDALPTSATEYQRAEAARVSSQAQILEAMEDPNIPQDRKIDLAAEAVTALETETRLAEADSPEAKAAKEARVEVASVYAEQTSKDTKTAKGQQRYLEAARAYSTAVNDADASNAARLSAAIDFANATDNPLSGATPKERGEAAIDLHRVSNLQGSGVTADESQRISQRLQDLAADNSIPAALRIQAAEASIASLNDKSTLSEKLAAAEALSHALSADGADEAAQSRRKDAHAAVVEAAEAVRADSGTTTAQRARAAEAKFQALNRPGSDATEAQRLDAAREWANTPGLSQKQQAEAKAARVAAAAAARTAGITADPAAAAPAAETAARPIAAAGAPSAEFGLAFAPEVQDAESLVRTAAEANRAVAAALADTENDAAKPRDLPAVQEAIRSNQEALAVERAVLDAADTSEQRRAQAAERVDRIQYNIDYYEALASQEGTVEELRNKPDLGNDLHREATRRGMQRELEATRAEIARLGDVDSLETSDDLDRLVQMQELEAEQSRILGEMKDDSSPSDVNRLRTELARAKSRQAEAPSDATRAQNPAAAMDAAIKKANDAAALADRAERLVEGDRTARRTQAGGAAPSALPGPADPSKVTLTVADTIDDIALRRKARDAAEEARNEAIRYAEDRIASIDGSDEGAADRNAQAMDEADRAFAVAADQEAARARQAYLVNQDDPGLRSAVTLARNFYANDEGNTRDYLIMK